MSKNTPEEPMEELFQPSSVTVRERCLEAAEALDELQRENMAFLSGGQVRPPESLYDALETFLDVVSACPEVGWPQKSWEFLRLTAVLATSAGNYGHDWRNSHSTWTREMSSQIPRICEQRADLVDPDPPKERVVELESIEDLVEQKVSDEQIAKIYGWFDATGSPDKSKAKSCRKGKVKAPESITFPPSFTGPTRQPHLGSVDHAVGIFQDVRQMAVA